MKWYLHVLKHYATFSGRASRSEYWYFVLFNVLVTIALAIVDVVTGKFSLSSGVGLLSGLYSLAVIVPGIAAAVRRLHDSDHSGWWMWIAVIPLIGPLVVLFFTVQPTQPVENQYGGFPPALPA